MYKPIPRPTVAAGVPPDRDRTYFDPCGTFAFTPKAGEFNLANAWWMAEAAFASYQDYSPAFAVDHPDLKEVNLQPALDAGYRKSAAFATDTQFLALESADVLIVAFRGTRLQGFKFPFLGDEVRGFAPHWGDIVTDAAFLPEVIASGIFVHQGFNKAFGVIKDALAKVVQPALDAGRPVWFCGHSLGAALATLAADAYRGQIQGLCTFGSPRVGNGGFVERLAGSVPLIWRFVHHRDVVTSVPPVTPDVSKWTSFFSKSQNQGSVGYAHVGQVMYISGGLTQWEIQTGGAARNNLASLAADAFSHAKEVANVLSQGFSAGNPGSWPVLWDALADHAPIYYTDKIFNALVDANS